VFKWRGKTKWISLKTSDRELAGRRVKEEIAKYKKTDPKASVMTLDALLKLYEQSLQGLAQHTQATRKSILGAFKSERPIRPTPTWEEFLAIVEDIRNQKLNADAKDSADLVEFMGRAGVGTAECANILGEHINFERDRITLYREKTDIGYTIPIFPQLKVLVERLKEEKKITVGKRVFRIMDPKKALNAACKRLKFQHYSARAFRRCFITRGIEVGVDFKTLSAWQGHQDGGVLIAKTYSHLRNEHSENMAKKLVG